MSDYEFIKCGVCGVCIGCKIDATIQKTIAEYDGWLIPKMNAASEAIAYWSPLEKRLRREMQYNTNAAHRELRQLQELRWQTVDKIIRSFKPIGCVCPVIRLHMTAPQDQRSSMSET